MTEKTVVIFRGVPGCGKSTFADLLLDLYPNAVKCSADDYRTLNIAEEYVYQPQETPMAHKWCQKLFEIAIANNVEFIIVDNTNTTKWEYEFYQKFAEENGYRVFIITVGTYGEEMVDVYTKRNKHNVPKETIVKMRNRLIEAL